MPNFLKLFLGFYGALMVLGLLVALVDPYGMWGHRLLFTPTEVLDNGGRQYHPARTTVEHYDYIFLGSSRVRHGLNPAPLQSLGHSYNAALGGASSFEISKFLLHLAAQSRPKAVLVGIDLFGFAPSREVKGDFASSQLAGKTLFEVQMQNSLSLEGLGSAAQALAKNLSRESLAPPVFFSDRVPGNHLKRWRSTAKHCAAFCWSGFDPKSPTIDATRLQELEDALDALAARNVNVVLFFNPVHETLLDLLDQLGLTDHFEALRRDIYLIAGQVNQRHGRKIALWDFTGCGEPWNEPIPEDPAQEMHFYYEMTHYTPALGNQVLKRLFPEIEIDAEPLADFGVNLTDIGSPDALPVLDFQRCRGPRSADLARIVKDTRKKRCEINRSWC